MANKETRILKGNTLEELRQKSNEVSLHLGDNEQLNTNLTDKTYNFTATEGDTLFSGTDDNAKLTRYELSPELTLDNTGGYIILKGATLPASFVTGATLTQAGGYSATIVSASDKKILVRISAGEFNSSEAITAGASSILAANVVRIIAEAFPISLLRVYKNGTEVLQDLLAGGWHSLNHVGDTALTGLSAGDVDDFVEGSYVYQGTTQSTEAGVQTNANWWGIVLSCDTDTLRVKSTNGSFSAGAQIRVLGGSDIISAGAHGALDIHDNSFGRSIEFNTPLSAGDTVKLFSMDLVSAVNELQDDVGVSENLTTVATNLVNAVNEHDAELGTITSGAMGTTASTVSGAIAEHETQIGNESITTIDGSSNTITGALNQLHTEVGSLSLNTAASDLTAAVNELEEDLFNAEGGTKRTRADLLTGDKTSIVDAINELHTELYDTGASFMGLTAVNFTAAINELRVELGNHTTLTTAASNAIAAINELEADLFNVEGGTKRTLASLTTADKTSIIDAINEIDGLQGNVAMGTSAATITGAIKEHEDQIGNSSIATISGSNNTITTALNQLHTEIGDITAINVNFTNDSNLVAALNELQTEVGANTFLSGGPADTIDAANLTSAINAIDSEIGDTAYTGTDITTAVSTAQTLLGSEAISTINTTVTGALNTLHGEVGTLSLAAGLGSTLTTAVNALNADIVTPGSLTGLTTTNKYLQGAINEHDAELGIITAAAMTTTASTVSTAIAELVLEKVDLSSSTKQTLTSQFDFKGNVGFIDDGVAGTNTFTFGSTTVLDVSNATILLPGNASGVNTFAVAFLEVDGDIETPMGLSIDREHVATIADTSDVRIQWNENHADGTNATRPARGWQLQGLDDSSISNTADIVTFYNAKELVSSNTESGISVTWDSTNNNFDFNVNDPTITLGTGPISGNVTITNLGNATFNTTLDSNSVTLGTHTTGNYVATVSGTTNEIEVSGSGGETAAVTVGLPNNVTIGNNLIVTNGLTVNGAVQLGNATTDTVVIAGNLEVQGTQTILNTDTLTVEDTLVLAGNGLVTEPTVGGFGLEVGPITSPSGVASNVTGAHSIVYNYANDRWEADGSLVLSEATLSSPTFDGQTYSPSRAVDLIGSTGITVSTALSGNNINSTFTNTDRGSSQAIWKRFAVAGQTTLTANNNNDLLTFIAGNDIVLTTGADTLTVTHQSFSTANTNAVDNGVYIKSVTVDNGHITNIESGDFDDYYYTQSTFSTAAAANTNARRSAAGDLSASRFYGNLDWGYITGEPTFDNYVSWTIQDGDTTSYTVTSGDTLKIASGGAIVSNFTADDVLTISHGDTSSVGNLSVDNSGNTFVQDIALTFDTYGHVTGATQTSGTVSIGNGTVTVSAGAGLTGSGAFSMNQTNSETVTLSHADTSSQASVSNSGNTFIQGVTLDTYGHVTGIASGTVTVGDGQIDGRTAGLGLSGSMDATANQTGNTTFTVTSNATTASTGNTIAYRDASGDIHARLFRSEYSPTNANIGFLMGQVNTTTDNYVRPSSAAQVRTFLNVANGATNTTAPNNGTLTLASSTGMSGSGTFTADQAGNTTVTYTNTDRGSSQAIFKNFTASAGGTATANINNDTLNLLGGTGIQTTRAGDTITISNTITNNNQLTNGAGYVTSSGNTIIGTDTDIDTAGSTIIDNIFVTDGVITSMGTRVLTLGNLGYTGATNATYNAPYLAGTGLDLAGTTFSVEADQRGDIKQMGFSNTSHFTFTSEYYADLYFLGDLDFRLTAGGTFHADADIIAYSTTTSSDAKLKKNIKKVENALDMVSALEGVTFDWKDDKRGSSAGVIAQNVEQVLPSAVKDVEDLKGNDTHKVVDYNQLSALFIEAIKELKDENKELRAMIEELKDINNN